MDQIAKSVVVFPATEQHMLDAGGEAKWRSSMSIPNTHRRRNAQISSRKNTVPARL